MRRRLAGQLAVMALKIDGLFHSRDITRGGRLPLYRVE
jgi:hypothetical protein